MTDHPIAELTQTEVDLIAALSSTAPQPGDPASRGVIKRQAAEKKELELQLARANRIIGWMMPYIGNMCPPKAGLSDLNLHCCENAVPDADKSTKGRPINQRALAEDHQKV